MSGKLLALKQFCINGRSILTGLAVVAISVSSSVVNASQAVIERFHSSPAVFIENQGQWDSSVKFVHKGDGAEIAHTGNGIVFSMSRAVGAGEDAKTEGMQFSVGFIGAKAVEPVGIGQSPTKFNFLIGKKENWKQNVGGFEKVAYKDLYKGIDLHTWGQRDSLKYEFHVAPGADYKQIALSYKGIKGLSIADNGTLTVNLPGSWGKMVDDKPYIYQEVDGKKVEVAGEFVLLSDNSYSFKITGEYDTTRELVIDPDVEWGSYLGGSGSDTCTAVALDSSNNILLTGWNRSNDWDADDDDGISGGWLTSISGGYVVKLSPSGTHVWSTYIVGFCFDIAADSSGYVLVTGITSHDDWDISGGEDEDYSGNNDGFVVKLTPSGGHEWSSYLGGTAYDCGICVTVDSSDNVIVAGETQSNNWWEGTGVSGGDDAIYDGGAYAGDIYVAKLADSDGSHMWSTYCGGTSDDFVNGIAVDSQDNIIIGGETESSNFRDGTGLSNGPDLSRNTNGDGFVVMYSSSGSFRCGSYLGGGSPDRVYAIAIDSSDNILVAGHTSSSSWDQSLISDAWEDSLSGTDDGFVVKFSFLTSTSTLVHEWGSYIGDYSIDKSYGVAVDNDDNVLTVGVTYSDSWTSGGWDQLLNGIEDGFIVALDSDGDYKWSSHFGGSGTDRANDVVVDSVGNIIIVGETPSDNWGISGGWDTSYDSDPNFAYNLYDGFVLKVDPIAPEVTEAPTINGGDLQRDSLLSISFTFTEDVNVDSSDLSIYSHNGTSWSAISMTGVVFSYDSNTYMATWSYDDQAATPAPITKDEGYYVAQLNFASITDMYSNTLATDLDEDEVDDYYVIELLPGDMDGNGVMELADINYFDDMIDAVNYGYDINLDGVLGDETDIAYLLGRLESLVGDIYDGTNSVSELDGIVDMSDFLLLKSNYGTGIAWEDGDLNCDGNVDINDFLLLKSNYNQSNPSFDPTKRTLEDRIGVCPTWP